MNNEFKVGDEVFLKSKIGNNHKEFGKILFIDLKKDEVVVEWDSGTIKRQKINEICHKKDLKSREKEFKNNVDEVNYYIKKCVKILEEARIISTHKLGRNLSAKNEHGYLFNIKDLQDVIYE